MSQPPNILSGIKVLDLSRVLAGPWSTQILGDFGADVLKVEAPGRGDDTRHWGPPYAADGESAYFLGCNRNKRSIAIDIARPEGAALVRRLAAEADVVVENHKVGGLKRYGLDAASLRALNPRLIYCSITGFGQDGPYADRPGYDFVVQAMGGLMSITGEPDGPPLKVGVAITDLFTGLYAVVSILLALRHAEATGEGQSIDCSLMDAQIAMLANQGMSWLVGGREAGRLGNAHPTIVPYRVFDCADGPVVVAVGNDSQFRAFCTALGAPGLAEDTLFARNPDRVINRAVLEPLLEVLVAGHQVGPLVARLVADGVPAGPVNGIAQVFGDPFVEARGAVTKAAREDGTTVPGLAFPAKLSATPARTRLPPPYLGADGAAALRDWLGLTADDMAALTRDDILGEERR